MTHPKAFKLAHLQYYATAPYPCSYLPGQQARSQVATPTHLVDHLIYSELVQHGFRRSGQYTYRPHCDNCAACIPVRVCVNEFQPNRSQRRVWRQHQNLQAYEHPLAFNPEHYALYQRYQISRHTHEGESEGDTQEQYSQFLLNSRVQTRLVEFRDSADVLRCVALIDMLEDGLSAVYTFYDTHHPHHSYGTYCILWQIRQAQALGLPHLYLGYWISASQKMRYKANFQPLEYYRQGCWSGFAQNPAPDLTE